jgi:hypothetical protein
VGNTRERCEEDAVALLREDVAEELAGLFANLPVTGSLKGLLMKGVADGNQKTRNKGPGTEIWGTLDLPHWGSQMKQDKKPALVRTQGRSECDKVNRSATRQGLIQ